MTSQNTATNKKKTRETKINEHNLFFFSSFSVNAGCVVDVAAETAARVVYSLLNLWVLIPWQSEILKAINFQTIFIRRKLLRRANEEKKSGIINAGVAEIARIYLNA